MIVKFVVMLLATTRLKKRYFVLSLSA